MTKIENLVDLDSYLQQQRMVIDESLARFLPEENLYPEIIHRAMRYSIFAGGKRIRSILALATGEALRGDPNQLMYFACALEMIHTYSLIHDDLPAMDDDDFRRGLPTLHKKYGEGIAILAGNGLLTQAFQLLTELPGGSEMADIKLRLMHCVCKAIGTSRGMLAGQVVDLMTQGQCFGRDELEFIHSAKTGALIQASVHGAALLSKAERDTVERLSKYSRRVGLAFQIVDDVLDVEGSAEELGKTAGKDDREKKATYPALYGVERSRQIVHELVEEAIGELEFLGPRGAVLSELAQFVSVRRF